MVRQIGTEVIGGPVPIAPATVVRRNDLVRVVSGLVVPVINAAVAGLAIAAETNPDQYRDDDKSEIGVWRLSEDFEVELPFSGRAIAAGDIGTTFNILSADGGTVNLSSSAAPAFKVIRLGQDTVMGDTTGNVIGVFLDAVSF